MPRHGGHDLINLSLSWAHQPAPNVKGFLLSCLRINGRHEEMSEEWKGAGWRREAGPTTEARGMDCSYPKRAGRSGLHISERFYNLRAWGRRWSSFYRTYGHLGRSKGSLW